MTVRDAINELDDNEKRRCVFSMDQNLFKPEYLEGNLSIIPMVTAVIGAVVLSIVSVVGFCLTLMPIAKNALHGLYSVFPKFFDMVAEAKAAQSGILSQKGGSQARIALGSIARVLLCMVPNVRTITDFDDELLDPKAYFIKAIPWMCLQVFMGVFIFFGYPARIANKVSTFGTSVFDVVLLNVDPVAWVEKLPTKFTILSLSSEGSNDPFDKVVVKATKEAYNSLVGELTDVTKEQRVQVGKQVENWIINEITPYSQYANPDAYTYTVKARIETQPPDISRVHDKHVNGSHQYVFVRPLAEFETGTAMSTENLYLRVDYVFTDKAKSEKGLKSVDCVMSIPSNLKINNVGGQVPTVTVDLKVEYSSNAVLQTLSKATGVYNGVDVFVKVNEGTNILIITPQNQKEKLPEGGGLTSISGLSYVQNNNVHGIKSINFTGSSILFTPVAEGSGIKPWAWGQGPKNETNQTPEDKPNKDKEGTGSGNGIGI